MITKEFQAEIEEALKKSGWGNMVIPIYLEAAEQATRIFARRGGEFDSLKFYEEYLQHSSTSISESVMETGRQQHAQITLQYEAQIEGLKAEYEPYIEVINDLHAEIEKLKEYKIMYESWER